MKDQDWDNVRCQCHILLRQAIERICDLTKQPPLYPLDSNFYSQMGIAPLPKSDLPILKGRLYDEYQIEVPLIQWQDQQFIRISVQGYNTQDDVDSLVNAVRALLPQVRLES
jgi:isopenicillin-N epimerase